MKLSVVPLLTDVISIQTSEKTWEPWYVCAYPWRETRQGCQFTEVCLQGHTELWFKKSLLDFKAMKDVQLAPGRPWKHIKSFGKVTTYTRGTKDLWSDCHFKCWDHQYCWLHLWMKPWFWCFNHDCICLYILFIKRKVTN